MISIPKQMQFVARASLVVHRLAYIELHVEEVTAAVAHAVAAALSAMFFNGPPHRLIVVRENGFEFHDLLKNVAQVREWLAKRILGDIEGRVIQWNPDANFGFIEAEVNGPDGDPTFARFYFNGHHMRERDLQELLRDCSGDLRPADQIPVVFQDGGVVGDQKNKKVLFVRLTTPSHAAAV